MSAQRLVLLLAALVLVTSAGEARAVSPNVVVEEASNVAGREFIELVNRAPSPAPLAGATLDVGGCAYVLTGAPLASGQHHLVALTGYAGAPAPDESAPCALTAPAELTLGSVDDFAFGAPPAGSSWRRKGFGLQDTDDDAGDFEPADPPDPQNRTFEDPDFDGLSTAADNCDGVPNADQANLDGDADGDVCDPDDDNDLRADGSDVCPRAPAATADGCPTPAPPPGPPADPLIVADRRVPPASPIDIFDRSPATGAKTSRAAILANLVVGTRQIRFTLSRAARVTLTIERCERLRRKACALASPLPGPIVHRGKAGANVVSFARRRSLRRGRYRIAATTVDASGVRSSTTIRSNFTVSRR